MKRFAALLALSLAAGGSSALAGPVTGTQGGTTTHGPQIRVFTRTIGGKQVEEAYLLLNRGKRYTRRGKARPPKCRRGLFGRVVNAPCFERRRIGGVPRGRR